MDIDALLSPDVQEFIDAHLSDDLPALLLKKSPFKTVSMAEIVQQIKGKSVARKKFPFLLKPGILFPPALNLEQASSEATAHYKSEMMNGQSMADLTCGFGIDAFFIAQHFPEVTLVEQNTLLSEIVQHNWTVLGQKAHFRNINLEDFLKQNTDSFDWIYLDPARRNEHKNKVFLLEDLSPNLLSIQDQLRAISADIMVKLSPMIDISYLISAIEKLTEIHIVAVKNEVKEILLHIKMAANEGPVRIKCVNLESEEPDFEFLAGHDSPVFSAFSEPRRYLYIPNNAVLKSGAFHEIAHQFNLDKLHPNTHLYTSEEFLEHFPGRKLEVVPVEAKSLRKGERYNIISKNHPLTPEMIKAKYKLKDGGQEYLIFTQTRQGKIILKSI